MIIYHNSRCPHSVCLIYVILRLSAPLQLKDANGYFFFVTLMVKIFQYFRLTANLFCRFSFNNQPIETLGLLGNSRSFNFPQCASD